MSFEAGTVEYSFDFDTGALIDGRREFNRFGERAGEELRGIDRKAGVLNTSMKKLSVGIKSALSVVGNVAKGAAALGGVALAIGAISAKVSKASVELDNMARQTKISANNFKALEFAAKRYGVTGEQIADISKDISDRLGEFITEGTGEFDPFLKVINATSEEANKLAREFENLSGPDVLARMVSMMEEAGASSAQMTTALEAIGNDASKLIPLFIDNAKEARGMISQFNAVNKQSLITPEQRDSLSKLSSNMNLLTGTVENVTESIVAGLAPNLNEMIVVLAEGIPDAIDMLRSSFTALFNIIGSDEFLNVAKVYGNQWIEAYNSISSTISDLWNEFRGLFNNIGGWASQGINLISKAFSQLPGNVSTVIKIMATLFGEFVQDIKSVGSFLKEAFNPENIFNADAMTKAYNKLKERLRQSGDLSKGMIIELVDENQKLNDMQDEATKVAIAKLKEKIELESKILELKGKQVSIEQTGGDSSGLLFEPINGKSGKSEEGESGLIDGEKYSREDAEGFARGIIDSGMSRIEQMERDEEKLRELRDKSLLDEELYLKSMNSLQEQMLKERISIVDQSFDSILGIMEQAGMEQSGVYKAMFALQKGFAVAQAGLNFAQSVSNASALPWPTNIPAIAMAVTQGVKFVSAVKGSSYSGGRRYGGDVSPGNTYEVNEAGVPEIVTAGNRDFLTMGNAGGKVTPLDKMNFGSQAPIINNYGSPDSVEAYNTDKGWVIDIAKKEAAKAAEGAYNKVVGDFSNNKGRVYDAASKNGNFRGQAGSGR